MIEAFAYPGGLPGYRTRSWFGLSHHGLSAWAGVCTADGSGCAGLLTVADGTKVTFSATNVPPGISESDHRKGMEASLKNLAMLLE